MKKLLRLPSFNEKCYQLLMQIPKGKIVTYGDIAHALGTHAYQAVGNAMANNPTPIIVPCHRIVKSNGDIGQFALGIPKKISLLKGEGVEVRKGKIVDFDLVRHIF
jgi:methylated-DNA-[protein]-cysteine S-methyltransferase